MRLNQYCSTICRSAAFVLAAQAFLGSGLCKLLAQQQEAPAMEIDWQAGPSMADLGELAHIFLPEGYIFAGPDDTRKLLEMMQNPTDGTELGMIMPGASDWFVIFEFDEVGYVKDDEKNDLDARAMLDSIRRGTQASNEERKRRGWATIEILGWQQEPQYNAQTQNLEWAIRAQSEGDLIVNYNTRLLGRSGVMRVSLVTDPQALEEVAPLYAQVLQGFSFKAGYTYAEYREGDKLAQYGLAALVTGGAAAVAAKSGLLAKFFKGFWKILILVAAGGAAFIKKIFGDKGRE